jgi:hypothetical protein
VLRPFRSIMHFHCRFMAWLPSRIPDKISSPVLTKKKIGSIVGWIETQVSRNGSKTRGREFAPTGPENST